MADPPRRFPLPWHADKIAGGYVVRDANGQTLAYLYSRENEDEARQAKVLTADEARRIAVNIARLPELLGKAERELVAPPAFGRPADAFGVRHAPLQGRITRQLRRRCILRLPERRRRILIDGAGQTRRESAPRARQAY
jgi:hypothetical protein